MDEFDIRLILVLLFIIFGSSLIAYFRKLKHKLFKPNIPVFKVIYNLKHEEPIILENQTLIIPEHLILGAVAAYDDIQTIPEIESGTQSVLLEQLENKFYSKQENKIFATAAIKAFRAWHSGAMLKILDPHNQFSKKQKKQIMPAVTAPAFQEFVIYTFLGIENADLMPETMSKLQKQYAVFFNDYTFEEGEFLLAWANQCMMTNKHLILFNDDDTPKIKSCILLPDIQGITVTEVGFKKSN